MASPMITYALIGFVVILLMAVGYLYFFRDGTEMAEEAVYDADTCTSFITSSTCSDAGFTASETTCSALGYSKTASGSATLTTSSAFCKSLSANIALFASNVVSYYTRNTAVKKVASSGSTTTVTIYEGQTSPLFTTSNDVSNWVGTNTTEVASILNNVAEINQVAKSATLFSGAPGLLNNLGTTMAIMFGAASAPTGYKVPTAIWKSQLTDTDGTTWSTLDTSVLGAAVIEALKTLPGDHLTYCT
jgi:hypothetical protein